MTGFFSAERPVTHDRPSRFCAGCANSLTRSDRNSLRAGSYRPSTQFRMIQVSPQPGSPSDTTPKAIDDEVFFEQRPHALTGHVVVVMRGGMQGLKERICRHA
jgi:hypothetical protein